MVRFSCFTPSHYQSPKTVQDLGGTMHSNSKKKSQDQAIKVLSGSSSTNRKADDNNLSNKSVEQISSPSSHEDCWKSEFLNGNICLDDSKEFLQMMRLKKSQSLGNILDKESGFSCGDVTDDEIDRGISFDYSHDKSMKRDSDSFNDNASAEFYAHENLGINFHNKHQENDLVESFDLFTDHVHHESLFSTEVLKQFDGEQHADVDEQSADHVADSGHLSSDIPPIFARSRSVTNLRVDAANTTEDAVTHKVMGPRSRSFGNLHSINGGMAEFPNGDEALCSGVTLHRRIAASNAYNLPQTSYLDRKGSPFHVDSGEECLLLNTNGGLIEGQEGDEKYWRERLNGDNKSIDGYDSHEYYGLANEVREPETDDVNIKKNLQQETPIQIGDELTSKEFSIKRIEEWISQIDIGNSSIVEELGESSGSFSSKETQLEVDVPTPMLDARGNLGMEVAYNYISSLTATSSSAQMANLGLVAVPFLSAFVSLRLLNLSGNAIVRITAGALPRGLHVLNLSKNNITAIEGLRDLTRLRVLDLSYNRIVRIGHGLASCSSLKELNLAGNKISEVEGLHRLLKLNTLDLRSNKISTAKGLGQLAANYGSLQAINLEGNPAQRNVGDEQLKKYLLGLLPNLVYYNKQTIRASGLKEVSDRPTRSVVTHQFDRGMRTEHKLSRRGSHGSGLHKSPNHVRSSHAVGSSLKQSKSRNAESRHVRLPPIGSKPNNHLPDIGGKLVSLQPSNPIRRIQSEGTL